MQAQNAGQKAVDDAKPDTLLGSGECHSSLSSAGWLLGSVPIRLLVWPSCVVPPAERVGPAGVT